MGWPRQYRGIAVGSRTAPGLAQCNIFNRRYIQAVDADWVTRNTYQRYPSKMRLGMVPFFPLHVFSVQPLSIRCTGEISDFQVQTRCGVGGLLIGLRDFARADVKANI
jgi:hypothetical protein